MSGQLTRCINIINSATSERNSQYVQLAVSVALGPNLPGSRQTVKDQMDAYAQDTRLFKAAIKILKRKRSLAKAAEDKAAEPQAVEDGKKKCKLEEGQHPL
jgi:hypothetical protein